MRQTFFNIYFIASAIWFAVMFFAGITDEEQNFVDNTPYLITLLISLINMAFAVYISTLTPDNYYENSTTKN